MVSHSVRILIISLNWRSIEILKKNANVAVTNRASDVSTVADKTKMVGKT